MGESEKKTISSGWNILIIFISIFGVLANVLLFDRNRQGMRGEYSEYEENVLLFSGTSNENSIYRRLYNYRLCQIGLAVIIVTIVILILVAIIRRRAALFTAYAALAVIGAVVLVYFTDMPGVNRNLKNAYFILAGTIVSMLGMTIGSWAKKASVIWISLLVMLGACYFATRINVSIAYVLFLGNYAALIFLAALHVHGLKAAAKPRPVVTAPAAPVTVGSAFGEAATASAASAEVTTAAPAYTEAASAAAQASAPATIPGTASLFACDNVLIDQKVRAFRIGNAYGLYAEDGTNVGFVAQENISGGAKAAQIMLGKNMKHLQGFTFVIYDANNQRVASLNRKGLGYLNFEDAAGNPIGTLKRGKLFNDNGEVVASIKTAGIGKANVLDANGQVMATLHKKWNGLVKTVFTTSDKYLVSFTPGLAAPSKALALALCVGLDFLAAE